MNRWKLATLALCIGLGAPLSPAMAQSQGSKVESRINGVSALKVEEQKDGTLIRINGSATPTFSVFRLNDPARLFIDISNSELKGDAQSERVNNGVISQVALLEFKDNIQSVTRVIIGFDEAAHYDVRTDGNDVVVFVDGAKRHTAGAMAKVDTQKVEELERRYQAEVARSQNEVTAANRELGQTRERLTKAESELQALRAEVEGSQGAQRDALNNAIASKTRELEATKREVQEREAIVSSLERQVAKLEGERDAERRRVVQLAKERDEALAATKSLSARTDAELKQAAMASAKLESELNKANSKAVKAESEHQKAQRELQAAKERETRLREQVELLASSSKSGQNVAAELKSLEKEQQRVRAELAQREADMEASKASMLRAKSDLERAQQAIASKDAEIAKLRGELAEAKSNSNENRGIVAQAVPVDVENNVRGIRLENDGQKSRIVVEMEKPGSFETLPWEESRAVMILNNVELPPALERTVANKGESGAVRFVSSFRDQQGRVRLEAELGENATDVVRQDGNTLVWEFAKTENTRVDWGVTEQSRPADPAFTSAPPRYPSVVTDPTQVSTVPGMSRKRITIDLREADIQNVLRLLAKEGGVNIVSGQGVSGTVTVRLRSVPLDEVFLTVLQARSLGFEKRGNVIRVAPQDTLVKEQTARAEQRAAAEQTRPLEVFLMPVNYAKASEMESQVSGLLSPRGTVTIDQRTNTLVIKDIPDNLAAVRQLVESLDSQVPQVLIEARIVETNDTFAHQMGIQWGGDVSFSQANGNPTGLLFPSVLGIAGGATDAQAPTAGTSSNPNFAVNLPAPVGTGSGGSLGLTMGSVGGAVNLNLRLSAFESAGHAKIVSSPKILTLNNKPATISQGTSIPISVVSAAGVQTVFVDATLELTVTPQVTPDGNIQLQISASKNEPDFQNTGARGDPTIIRKQAETELLIKDGDTTVIGGIYTQNAGTSVSAVPFFHKIPILGFFFRTTSESERRTELLIFITPKIVNRAESIGGSSASR